MRAAACALAIALCAGCPSFHPAALPGAPADATFVDIDGVHVRYREAGTGPAVVLIHGYGASLDSWAGVVPDLAAHHRVIAVDLKGFGWSSRPDGDYSPAAEAQLVWAVLDKLGVKDVAIVGHSWGTSVALSMAVAHPDRTRKVALYDAYVYDDQVPGFFRWAETGGLGEALFGLFYTERIEERAALAYYDERWVTQARVERVEEDLDKPGTVAAALAVARSHHFAELHEQLRGFTKPVLLLWGREDQVTPLPFGERLVNELANARLIVYPRCGHIPMVEARAPSTRDLVEFLSEPAATTDGEPAATDSPNSRRKNEPTEPTEKRDRSITSSPWAPWAHSSSANLLLPLSDLAKLGSELTPRLYAAPREQTEVVVHGYLRTRAADLYNLDLDRGLDARGQPLFPVPLGGGQSLDAADLRARTDLAVYARGVGVAVKSRIDWLDNAALGGSPDLAGGSPATSRGQLPSAVLIKRAWAEALTPAGTLAVGRMGAHFGLGIAVNGGDCEDCDHGDAADRLAFVSPLFGHLVAVAYDVASRGPFTPSKDGAHAIALEPTDRAAGPTIAIFKVHSPATLVRRADAGLVSVEYAAYLTRRTQDRDVPASYLAAPAPTTFTSNDLVSRGFSATGAGAWLRATGAAFRVEAELAYLSASIANPSLVPGAAITEPITSTQLGAALESDFALASAHLGFDSGYASGDSAPGFGAFPTATNGDSQASPPRDRTVDNFRFHPDYRIDQILFREIIGTITDAFYVRPHARALLLEAGAGRLEAGAAVIASWAIEGASTPSGERALGIEVDPELRYASRDGFAATIDYGLLFPGAAFDNPTANLKAQPAQVVRARLAFAF